MLFYLLPPTYLYSTSIWFIAKLPPLQQNDISSPASNVLMQQSAIYLSTRAALLHQDSFLPPVSNVPMKHVYLVDNQTNSTPTGWSLIFWLLCSLQSAQLVECQATWTLKAFSAFFPNSCQRTLWLLHIVDYHLWQSDHETSSPKATVTFITSNYNNQQ